MHGVLGVDLDAQMEFLKACVPEGVRRRVGDSSIHLDACVANGAEGYGPIEAEVLYAFVASRRPRRVLQVGAGVSTAVVLQAKRDFALETEVACVDPWPTDYLRRAASRGEIRLYEEPAQTVDLIELTALSEGDLLFVDSTHTVKVGGEVPRLILEVLPRLQPGVFVHFHDINWPYDYSPDLLGGVLFFWEETSLLLAFMVGNVGMVIRMSLSMLHHDRATELQTVFPNYCPHPMADGLYIAGPQGAHFPSATYLQRL